MKIDWNRKYNTIAVYAFLTATAATAVLYMLKNLGMVSDKFMELVSLLAPFLYGFAIAYIVSPMLEFFEGVILKNSKKVTAKSARKWSILATYVSVFLIIGVLFWIIIPEVALSISNIGYKTLNFINNIDTYIDGLNGLIPFHEIPPDILNNIRDTVTSFMLNLYQFISKAVPHIFNATIKFSTGLMNFVLGIIISVYVLSSKELFFAQTKKILCAFMKKETVDYIVDLTHEGNQIFTGFISGKILDSVIIGIICFVSMSILKIPSAMLVSVIVGVTNVIPYFGPFIGAIPSALIILVDSPTKALVFVVLIFIIQQFDGNILGPKILGNSTGLSAFWVIFAILFFGGTLKVLGMFIGVPTFAVIYNLIRRFVNYRLRKKDMPTATEAYASDESELL